MHINFFGEELVLNSERSIYWPQQRAVLLSDVHFGKDTYFRQHGIPIPSGWVDLDLERITKLLNRYQAKTLYVLGDFIHHHTAVPGDLIDDLRRWRKTCSDVDIFVILGNHDRKLREVLPADLDIELINGYLDVGELRLQHDPKPNQARPHIAGHVHPVMSVGSSLDHLRLACFARQKQVLILPAFGSGTGGYALRPHETDESWVIAEKHIFHLAGAAVGERRG